MSKTSGALVLRRKPYTRTLLIWKTAFVSFIVIATNVIGNFALARGMRDVGIVESWSPMPYIHAFAHPWVFVGILFMASWMLSRLALLSWADLSYVMPVTAFSYVLSAIVGILYLKETVSDLHWAGIVMITLGTALVSLTFPGASAVGRKT